MRYGYAIGAANPHPELRATALLEVRRLYAVRPQASRFGYSVGLGGIEIAIFDNDLLRARRRPIAQNRNRRL